MFCLLEWPWDVAASPILEEFGFRDGVKTDERPRVCWIPIGPLCLFPFYDASYHRETGSRTVLDGVVSSYSPCIKALLYARRNEMHSNDGQASNKTVLVSMDSTTGCSELPFAEMETIELDPFLPASIPRVVLHRPNKKDVLGALMAAQCLILLATANHTCRAL
jgi:hypothetical protein